MLSLLLALVSDNDKGAAVLVLGDLGFDSVSLYEQKSRACLGTIGHIKFCHLRQFTLAHKLLGWTYAWPWRASLGAPTERRQRHKSLEMEGGILGRRSRQKSGAGRGCLVLVDSPLFLPHTQVTLELSDFRTSTRSVHRCSSNCLPAFLDIRLHHKTTYLEYSILPSITRRQLNK